MRWTSLYNTGPSERRWSDFVEFDRSTAARRTFVVTAVDLRDGVLLRFRNKAARTSRPTVRTRLQDHALTAHASRAAAWRRNFPGPRSTAGSAGTAASSTIRRSATRSDAFSDRREVFRLVVIINLYPLTGQRAANLLQVADRVHELSFGNRPAAGSPVGRADQQAGRHDRRPAEGRRRRETAAEA